MEVAPFFVDFHHFLSIFTIFIDFHDLRTFVAIYILSRFTHFFRKFFLAKIAYSATSHVFCMYDHHLPGSTKFCRALCYYLIQCLDLWARNKYLWRLGLMAQIFLLCSLIFFMWEEWVFSAFGAPWVWKFANETFTASLDGVAAVDWQSWHISNHFQVQS